MGEEIINVYYKIIEYIRSALNKRGVFLTTFSSKKSLVLVLGHSTVPTENLGFKGVKWVMISTEIIIIPNNLIIIPDN